MFSPKAPHLPQFFFAIMAVAILEIPPPSIRPPPGFPESKHHSAKIRPPKALPPLPLQKTTSYIDDVSVSLLGKDVLINTTNMAPIAENLIHRAFYLNLSFSVEKATESISSNLKALKNQRISHKFLPFRPPYLLLCRPHS
jgi:hypothetical protein